jgi:hypothetical protein
LGAVVGALAAQRVAERAARRTQIEADCRELSAAITSAHSVCNTALLIKAQFVSEMYAEYAALRDQYAKASLRSSQDKLAVRISHQSFSVPVIAVDRLRSRLDASRAASLRAHVILDSIEGAVDGLLASLELREIKGRAIKETAAHDPFPLYFGLPDSAGHVDTSYRDSIENTHQLTDQVIFYCVTLLDDLHATALAHEDTWRRYLGPDFERPPVVLFDESRAWGLVPTQEGFLDWLDGLPKNRKAEAASRTKPSALSRARSLLIR